MLTPEVNNYLNSLLEEINGIKSIWLLGSRANMTANPESDWDFFVFGDDTVFEEIKNAPIFHLIKIDLLVVASDGTFNKPYGTQKTGDLNTWLWKILTDDTAEYQSSKCRAFDPESDGYARNASPFVSDMLKAFRVKGT